MIERDIEREKVSVIIKVDQMIGQKCLVGRVRRRRHFMKFYLVESLQIDPLSCEEGICHE